LLTQRLPLRGGGPNPSHAVGDGARRAVTMSFVITPTAAAVRAIIIIP
jgi:hypothetical protein